MITNLRMELFGALVSTHSWLLLRVGDVDGQVEGGADDEVELVPAALVPVQAGPGDHPLQQGSNQVMVSSVSSSYVLC